MVTLETFRTNEDAFLLVLVKIVEEKKFLVFLLDPWKAGFRDFQIHEGNMKSLKQEIGIPTIKFEKITKKETAKLLKQNYDIARELDVEISEEAKNWFDKLGVDKIDISGSLYKCFNCQSGNLTDEEVTEILDIAKLELKEEKVGTEHEDQYFYICEKCKGEMHESHT